MKKIWKYTMLPECSHNIPIGAQLLSVHGQGEEICMWALVNPDAEKETRKFIGVGTGYAIPDQPMEFVGTAHIYGGELVFHIFELK